MDVIQRIEPVIIELERERECVVVVAHQAVGAGWGRGWGCRRTRQWVRGPRWWWWWW